MGNGKEDCGIKNKIVIYIKRYEEIIAYLAVGILSTLLAWTIWLILARYVFDIYIVWQNAMLSIVSWLLCDIVVYAMNRFFVFKSKNPQILFEFIQFSTGRLLTLGIDAVMMMLLVNLCGMDGIISKIIVSIIVIITNYLISKLVVFRK